jgi:hypothetical protein
LFDKISKVADVSWAINVLFCQLLCDIFIHKAFTTVGKQVTDFYFADGIGPKLDVRDSLKPCSRFVKELLASGAWCVWRSAAISFFDGRKFSFTINLEDAES